MREAPGHPTNGFQNSERVRVWDPGVRLFHWLLVAAVGVAAATGLSGPRAHLNLHIAAGVAVAALVVFRLVWGFTGPTYARFSSFLFRPSTIAARLTGLLAGRHSAYLGHNPLGALMVFALLTMLTLNVATGVLTLGGVDKQGPLAFVTTYAAGSATQRVHQALAYVLLAMIVAHLAGVAHESIRGRSNLVLAMMTGEKTAAAGAGAAKPARALPLMAGLITAFLLTGAAYETVALSSRHAFGVPVATLDPTYVRECGSCHMPYPPSLAPRSRWTAIMRGLEDHFGEDASLEPDLMVRIGAYLIDNSAEKWDTRPAHELALSNPDDPLRLTATPFWTWTHRTIPLRVFKSRAVGAKGACNACHRDALTGRFDPQSIAIPELALQ